MKKIKGDIILHMYTKNHNHIRYSSWDMEWDRMFVIFDQFLPFHPPNNPQNQNFEKMKKASGGVIILHMCTKNQDHMQRVRFKFLKLYSEKYL